MSSPPDPHEIARRTLEIIPFVMRVMNAELRSTRLEVIPSHMGLLGMLTTRPHTLSEMARAMSVSAPTMSNTISTLEARGWVERERDTRDRRVVYVRLSEHGRHMLDKIDQFTEDRLTEILAPLDDHERATLLHGLTLLNERFASALGHTPPHGYYTAEQQANPPDDDYSDYPEEEDFP
jgi:DNA-binding MarR family transcriptional regulator